MSEPYLWDIRALPQVKTMGCGSEIGSPQNGALLNEGVKPAVPWWFNFDPCPHGNLSHKQNLTNFIGKMHRMVKGDDLHCCRSGTPAVTSLDASDDKSPKGTDWTWALKRTQHVQKSRSKGSPSDARDIFQASTGGRIVGPELLTVRRLHVTVTEGSLNSISGKGSFRSMPNFMC